MELPIDFPHVAPEGFSYKVEQFKKNIDAIWLCHPDKYTFTSDPVRTIWGFIKYKRIKGSSSHTYHAPINCNKVGVGVDINDTRVYTAMQLNLTPLEKAFS